MAEAQSLRSRMNNIRRTRASAADHRAVGIDLLCTNSVAIAVRCVGLWAWLLARGIKICNARAQSAALYASC